MSAKTPEHALRPRLTYESLPENPPAGVVLYCKDCRAEYSAARYDYSFRIGGDLEPNQRPVCGAGCGGPLALVRRVVRYVRVSPSAV